MLEILLVDDDDATRGCVAEALERAGHKVTCAADGAQALEVYRERTFDMAICDVQMPKVDGLTLFRRLRQASPAMPVVLMTAYGQIPDAIDVLRDGALDYVTKPFDADELVATIVQPIAERQDARVRLGGGGVEPRAGVRARTVAVSAKMRTLLARASVLACTETPVLVRGERGSGKKHVARMLHDLGPRRDGPFVVVPSAALPEAMVEGCLPELRDCSGGAGWLHAAQGGTLVLQDVDELPIDAQSGLLRALEVPVARARRSSAWKPLGVRIVSLTRADLRRAAAEGRFLPPLVDQLTAAELSVAPLRDRPEDVMPLAEELLERLTPPGAVPPHIERGAREVLVRYGFPHNVHELSAALDHARVMSDGDRIDAEHLPAWILGRGRR